MERKTEVIQVRLSRREKQALQKLIRVTPGTVNYSEWIRLQINEAAAVHQLMPADPMEELTVEEVEIAEELGLEPWQFLAAKQKIQPQEGSSEN